MEIASELQVFAGSCMPLQEFAWQHSGILRKTESPGILRI